MDAQIPVSTIIYLVNSTNSWFNHVSKPILPNTYHLILLSINESEDVLNIIGTRSDYDVYMIKTADISSRAHSIFTYVIYNN